eukprot:scaffold2766_cov147-Skeletonema_menzelii.AAC.2
MAKTKREAELPEVSRKFLTDFENSDTCTQRPKIQEHVGTSTKNLGSLHSPPQASFSATQPKLGSACTQRSALPTRRAQSRSMTTKLVELNAFNLDTTATKLRSP